MRTHRAAARVVFRFNADGLIDTADIYWDQLTMLTQLGHQAAA